METPPHRRACHQSSPELTGSSCLLLTGGLRGKKEGCGKKIPNLQTNPQQGWGVWIFRKCLLGSCGCHGVKTEKQRTKASKASSTGLAFRPQSCLLSKRMGTLGRPCRTLVSSARAIHNMIFGAKNQERELARS